MAIRKIVKYGETSLREPSKEVHKVSQKVKNLVQDMLDTMYSQNGVGLAAPQLGILKKMIAIVAPDEFGNEHEFALINPKLLSYSDELTYLEGGEGCLSVDRPCDALIHRPARVTFESYFYDLETGKLEKKKVKLKGYLAVVYQHEYDHLNGVLFVDRANKVDPKFVPENSKPIIFKEN